MAQRTVLLLFVSMQAFAQSSSPMPDTCDAHNPASCEQSETSDVAGFIQLGKIVLDAELDSEQKQNLTGSNSVTGICVLTGDSEKCVFPFKYKGYTYNACVMADTNTPWCSLKVDSSGEHIAGKWDYCGKNCGTGAHVTCTTVVHEGYGKGNKDCVFPFTFEGTTFTGCTTQGSSREWCAVKVSSSGAFIDGEWGYCSASCAQKTSNTLPAIGWKSPNAGKVAGLYTFGAPPVAKQHLWDYTQESGCFQGNRVYAQAEHLNVQFVDAVAQLVAKSSFKLLHPHISPMIAKKSKPIYQGVCDSMQITWPKGSGIRGTLHPISNYGSILGTESASSSYPVTSKMVVFASDAYQDDANTLKQSLEESGVHIVHEIKDIKSSGFFGGDYDRILLVQDSSTLDCTLIFEGSDSVDDFTKTNIIATKNMFCGTPDVHKGFSHELRRVLKSDVYQNLIKPKLPQCKQVFTTGHSLGGAMASLFAYCANYAPPHSDDYQLLAWEDGETKLMGSP